MAENTHTGLPVLMPARTAPVVHTPTAQTLPARPVPTIAPLALGGIRDRMRARRLARNADTASRTEQAVERYYQADEARERAQQAAEGAHYERQGIIAKAESQLAGHVTALVNAYTEVDRVLYVRELTRLSFEEQQRVDQQKRQLEPARFQQVALPIIKELADGQAELNNVRRSEEAAQAKHARSQQLAAADHRNELMLRGSRQLEIASQLKTHLAALRGTAEPADTAPEEFRRHYATERRVHLNLDAGEARIAEIYDRARAERRNLTPDEIEKVDALADAAEAAEADVRRGAASDLAAE